ncbi:MAG: DUF2285 domain-containing protein [Sphingomonadales bacterium]|nr:DUF2285 domain-containing protein [Sphingomonadales bacterium]
MPSILRNYEKNRRAWPGGGACAFPTDPEANVRECPALWSPEIAPDVVTIEAANPAGAIPLPKGSEPLAEYASGTDRHYVIAIASARLRLCVRSMPDLAIPTLTIPCDPACALRLAAAARFQRVTQGKQPNIDRAVVPTAYQRSRWVQFLALHDALEAGASSRTLAFDLVFPRHRPLRGAEWKGSGERRHVLRLTAAARRLVAGGYRSLLLHH